MQKRLILEITVINRAIENDCREGEGGTRHYPPGHLFLQMQLHVIYFYGVTSRIRFMFLLFTQVSRKPSPLICCKQFGTN
jgi:hypothetical protein